MTEGSTAGGTPFGDDRGPAEEPVPGEAELIAGLTRADAEAAALEGRQVSGPIERDVARRILREGEVSVVGRLLVASNATFFCLVEGEDATGRRRTVSAVYKPIRGERPLFDFPDGTLACREVAAHEVSDATGWDVIPPTVLRDGPFGEGMLQLWIEVDDEVDLGELLDSDNAALRRMAVLDAVLNNADRKAGHLLYTAEDRIQGCDNGLTFAIEPKLRTVLWRWRGQPLTADEKAVLAQLRTDLGGRLGEELARFLAPEEIVATTRRVDRLLSTGRMPQPARNRPAVPWPPY
jgi:uncharacterized repeat protein (TIGR03843 family)